MSRESILERNRKRAQENDQKMGAKALGTSALNYSTQQSLAQAAAEKTAREEAVQRLTSIQQPWLENITPVTTPVRPAAKTTAGTGTPSQSPLERANNVVQGALRQWAGTTGTGVANLLDRAARQWQHQTQGYQEDPTSYLDQPRSGQWQTPEILEELYDISAGATREGSEQVERAKAGLGKVGSFAVDVASQIPQMAADAAFGAVTGGVGLVPLALRSYGGGVQEAMEDGADRDQASLYGLASGAKEVLTEKLFGVALPFSRIYGGGSLDDAVQRGIQKAVSRVASTEAGQRALGGGLTLAASALTEGAEEFIADWMGWQLPGIIYGGEVASAEDMLSDSLYDFLLGSIMGGVGGAVSPATYHYSLPTAQEGGAVVNSGTAAGVDGQSTAQNVNIPTAARQAIDQLSRGEEITGGQAEQIARSQEAVELLGQVTGVEINRDAPISQVKADIRAVANTRSAAQVQESQTWAQVQAQNTQTQAQSPRTAEVRAVDQARVRQAAQSMGMGESGTRAMTAAYDGEADAAEYSAGFAALYQAGLTGRGRDQVGSQYAAKLSQAQQYAAYTAGQNDAAASLQREQAGVQYATVYGEEAGFIPSEHSKGLSEETTRLYNILGKATGTKITVTAATGAEGANGWYREGTIYIAEDAQNAGEVVAMHEVTHRLQEIAPAEYRRYRDYAVNALAAQEGGGASLVERYKARYADSGVVLTTEQAMDEIAADFTQALTADPARFEQLVQDDRSVARKVLDAVRDFIRRLKTAVGSRRAQDRAAVKEYGVDMATLEEAARLWEKAYDAAARQTRQAAGQTKSAAQGDGAARFSIRYDQDNNPYVVIEEDILAGVPRSEWVKTVKDNLRQKFPDGVTVGNNVIEINAQSRREMTFSKYMQRLFNVEPQMYEDKLRATNNADEIVRAARNWVNEALLHPRKDDIIDFARGEVLMRIGSNDYTAQVIVGNRGAHGLLLYDIINLAPETIQAQTKKADAVYTTNTQNGPRGRGPASANTSISNTDGNVNKKSNAAIAKDPSPGTDRSTASGFTDSISETGGDVNGRFSLKSQVEENGSLVALHNLTEDKLRSALRLGGFPMPSIAVTRADIPHTNFGNITLVMDRQAVDPKANRRNTVYSADAWTPTFPAIEYEADPQVERRISRRIGELSGQVDPFFRNDLGRIQYGLEDYLNRHGGEEGLVQWAMDNYGLKAAYLEERGQHIAAATTQREADRGYSPERADRYQAVTQALGITDPAEIGRLNIKETRERYGEALEAAFPGMTKSALRMSSVLRQVQAYLEDQGRGPVYETVTDGAATRRAVDQALDQAGYEAWVRALYAGIEGASGVYNNKERFTPGGSLRSFRQLHYPVTLDNITKAMAGQNGGNTKNVSGFYGIKSLRAGTARRFKSIVDMHKLEGRLQNLTESEQQAIADALDGRLLEITAELAEKGPRGLVPGDLTQADAIGSIMVEIAEGGTYTIDSVMKKFNGEYQYHIGNELAAKVRDLLFDVSQMPVNLFEAKPERSVHFSEVLAAVVPDNAGSGLSEALTQAGVGQVLTYEAGNEADRLAKVNSVENARFSLKGEDLLRENAALQEENALLRERLDYWKGQTRRTRLGEVDRKAVDRAARALIVDFDATISAGDISGDLLSLYNYMGTGRDGSSELTHTEARRRANEIARRVVESAQVTDDSMYQEYRQLREYLRGTRIAVSQEDVGAIADFEDLRRRNFGRVDLRRGGESNVDTVYQELSELYPEFFDEQREVNTADQLSRILEVAEQLYTTTTGNPFAGNLEQAVQGVSNEILERFFDIPQVKATFADRAERNVEQARQRGREQAARVREQRDGRIEQLRQQNRERVQRTIQRERATRERQLERLKNRYQARDAAGRDRRSRRELRARIIRHVGALSQKLRRPSDQRHIPESLRKPVAAMLEAINLESGYTVDPATGKRRKGGEGNPTKRTEAFRKLREEYARALQDGDTLILDPSLFGDETEGVQGNFDKVLSMGDKRLSDMSVEELQTVWDTIRAVERAATTAGQVLSKAKYTATRAWAGALERDTATRRSKRTLTKTGLLKSLENPYTFFSHYGEAGHAIYRMLRDAQDQQQVMVERVKEAAAKVADPKTAQKLERETHKFTTQGGAELTLSTAQLMELYLLMKREQARGHLLQGGIVQPEVKSARIRRGSESVQLTEGDLAAMAGMLTDEQAAIADGLQEITGGLLAQLGNEASMAAYGYRKFTEEHYWPIHSAKEGIYSRAENSQGNVRSIKNIGLAKTTAPNASNPLDIGSVFDTFAGHAGDMTDYAAWLLPMEDANRLFNFRYRDGEGNPTGRTVKSLLDAVGGAGSQQYWRELMNDIQNGIKERSDDPMTSAVSRGVGSFKGAAVGGNSRVVIQQPTAIFRTTVLLSPADIAAGLVQGATKGSGWQKAVKYSPIAMRKAQGGFDISSPVQMKETLFDGRSPVRKVNDFLSAPAGMADAVTWGKIWNACEWETARKHKELRRGSAAFYQAVNELFTEVIDQTQVVDGVLQRANIMRSGNAVAQQATSFMGEPVMALNMMLRAYDQMRYEQDPKKRGRAIKKLGRATAALVLTNLVNAAAQSIVDGMRDDDRDKKYWERVLSAFTGLTGEEESAWDKAMAAAMGNAGSGLNPLGQVPFVKDIYSLSQGYDVSRTDMEIFADLVRATQTLIQSADGGGPKTRLYAVKETAAAAGGIFGLPVGNVTRDAWAFLRTVAIDTGNLGLQYEMEKAVYNLGSESNRTRYLDILFQARASGDQELYEHIYQDMTAGGIPEDKIRSGMESRMKAAQGVESVSELTQRYLTPDQERTYDRLHGEISSSQVWRAANQEQREAVEDDLYALAAGTDAGQKLQEKIDGGTSYGISDGDYLLYRTALEMADAANQDPDKRNGSIDQAEAEAAIDMLTGLSDKARAYLWQSTNKGWSEKNNPYG